MIDERNNPEPPWKTRIRSSAILWTQIAAGNPDRGIVASNQTGQSQLYEWNVTSESLTQITCRPLGLVDAYLSGDGEYVYFLDDTGGNEIGHLHRIPINGGPSEDITPDLQPFSTWFFGTDGTGHHIGFTASYDGGFHIYERTHTAGSLQGLRELFYSRKFAYGPLYSFDGEIALIASTDRSSAREYSLVAIQTKDGKRLRELWDGPGSSIEGGRFLRKTAEARVLATTTRSGQKRPLIWDVRSGERIDIDLPQLAGDVIPIDWVSDGQSILVAQITEARHQLYLYHVLTGDLRRLDHPSGTFNFPGTYFSPVGTIYAQWQSSHCPSRLIELDPQNGSLKRTVLAGGDAPPSQPWRSIRFVSADGQEIQGWLAVPPGKGPFPTILHSHGGPETVMTEVFAPMSQAWLDHGFAYLTVNYRGSTTFGRDFQSKIWGNIGRWEIEDLVAAQKWLVNAGVSMPNAIFLNGWSYGGFLSLLGLSKYPSLWAGAMAGIAVADWTTMYEDASAVMKGYLAGIFCGTPQEVPENYAQSSPLTYADRVRAPILILQGENDSRTPARQIRRYEEKLRSLGKAIEVVWYEAGHLGAGTNLSIKQFELMHDFANRVIASLPQSSMNTSG